ncbi:hypothetical protein ACEWY4_012324 [Coilia grayii]|uniref:Coiled-coil domain-containing protein 60 n=1 Tax=Coilia grayii TaxID=363190 RepID=A0ABD1K065_9TELE
MGHAAKSAVAFSEAGGCPLALYRGIWSNSSAAPLKWLTFPRLVRGVRQGRGYFQLLQKEEQEAQEAKEREVQGRPGPRPPCLSSESKTDLESPVSPGLWGQSPSLSERKSRGGRGTQSAQPRPFTPIHYSLTSPQLHQLPLECVFRQLCCLNWLLEALTLGRAGRAAPVLSCWDPKDPGESRAAIKALTKEKAIQAKWEQFVSVPKTPRRPPTRPSRASSGRSFLRKTSNLSRASSSSLATTPTLGSLTSLVQGPSGAAGVTATGEDTERQSVAESSAEPPVSEYLQKLLEEVYQSVAKDLYGSGMIRDFEWNRQDSTFGFKKGSPRPKSCPARQLSSTARYIDRKCSRLDELRTSFEERAEELAQTFSDSLEAKSKKRWDSGLQRLQALCRKTSSLGGDIHQPTSLSRFEEDPDKPYSTQWLLLLLGNLDEAGERNRKLARVLEKLRRFAEERRLRVRPQVFLKVLGSLQLWELCLPDLCVAIEVVREHAVKMSREDYDAWLLTRISGAQGGQTSTNTS